MLWFIVISATELVNCSIFKYILCYGSSRKTGWARKEIYVFKYILCYGSSRVYLQHARPIDHLNTSYVMVHLNEHTNALCLSCHLNTSYVMVHHETLPVYSNLRVFKYILCYGSSPKNWMAAQRNLRI